MAVGGIGLYDSRWTLWDRIETPQIDQEMRGRPGAQRFEALQQGCAADVTRTLSVKVHVHVYR